MTPAGRLCCPALAALCLVLLGGSSSPGMFMTGGPEAQPAAPRVQRLTYTITFLGIPVARAILDEVQPGQPDGEWIVRGAARTTAFWEQFTHIRNSYITRFRAAGFQPSVYERRIDQKGLRFRRTEWYGREGAGDVDISPLPPLSPRYTARGEPASVDVLSVPAGEGNFFSALWYMRYTDWDRTVEATLPVWLEGQRWQVTIRRVGVGRRRAPEGRVEAWKLICRLNRLADETGAEEFPSQAGSGTDHITHHLMRENAELTVWIARQPSRRPIAVSVSMALFQVSARLREPFEDERLPF